MFKTRITVVFPTVVLVIGLVVYGNAQTQQDSLSIEADTITRLIPIEDIGVLKVGPADVPLTASGNVVLVINGVRVTGDLAVWRSGSKEIELNGGSVRIQLPPGPSSLTIRNRGGSTR